MTKEYVVLKCFNIWTTCRKKMSYAESFDIAHVLSWTDGLSEDLKDTEYSGNIVQSYVVQI